MQAPFFLVWMMLFRATWLALIIRSLQISNPLTRFSFDECEQSVRG
jgi:predicted Zn-dependent protease